MLDHSSYNASPQIQDLVTMLKQRGTFENDQRSDFRETVVCPVTIQLQYDLNKSRGFTKDISSGGICLISEIEIKTEQIATLAIFRVDDIPTTVRARCIWQSPFGDSYYQSGWKFLRRVLQNTK